MTVLAGCVNALGTHQVTGQARPSTSASDVVLYVTAPAGAVVIGQVASRSTIFGSDEVKTEYALERLKDEAAEVGANGIVLQAPPGTALGKRPGIVVQPDQLAAFVGKQDHDAVFSGTAIWVPGLKP